MYVPSAKIHDHANPDRIMAASFQPINRPSSDFDSTKNRPRSSLPSTGGLGDDERTKHSTKKSRRPKYSPLFFSSPTSTDSFPDVSGLLRDSSRKDKICQGSTLEHSHLGASTPIPSRSPSRVVLETSQGKAFERTRAPYSSPDNAFVRVTSVELSSPTYNGIPAYHPMSEPKSRYHLAREAKLIQSIEGTLEQRRPNKFTSSPPSCLSSSLYNQSSDISVDRSRSGSLDGHGKSSPATSIPSSEHPADTEMKAQPLSRSTTPELELPPYLYGLDRKDPKVKAYKRGLIAQLRAIKLEISGLTGLDTHSPERDLEDPLQSRTSKLEGRMAELVMQIEILLREGLIRRKDKILQVASDCVPPETESQSTAMDLRSLLSQMQSEKTDTSCTGRGSFPSDTENKSTTQGMGRSDTTQGGRNFSHRPGAAIVFGGEEKTSNDPGSDVKVSQIRDTVS